MYDVTVNWSGPGWYTCEGDPPVMTKMYQPDVDGAERRGISVGELARQQGRGTPRKLESTPSGVHVREV